MIRGTACSLTFLAALTLGAAARAQVDSQSFERGLELIKRERDQRIDRGISAADRAFFEYGGYYGFNFFNFQGSDGGGQMLLRHDLNLYASLNLDNAHLVYVRGLFRYDQWGEGDNTNGGDYETESELERAFYQFDLTRHRIAEGRDPIDFRLNFAGGRNLIHWANGLVLSQVLDGAFVSVGNRVISLDAVAGVTKKDTLDFDASRPNYDDDTSRGFYGGMLRLRPVPEHELFFYGVTQRDYNSSDFDADPLSGERDDQPDLPFLPTRYHYDSYYLGVGANGNLGDNLLYGVEIVYQGGEGLSNSFDSQGNSITQTEEDIRAWALDLKVDWLFHDANRSRLSFEAVLASGDDDRLNTSDTFGGNRPGTKDTAFNAFGLINTGLSFAPEVSNLVMFRAGASTFPMPSHPVFDKLQVGINTFAYFKLDNDAPIGEATTDDGYLGFEPDLFVNWQITSDVAFTTRYGVFLPGEAIDGDSSARHFIYTGITLAF